MARLRLALAGFGLVLIAAGILLARPPAGLARLDPGLSGSLRFEDRQGELLREMPVGGARSRWLTPADLPPWAVAALVEAEDRRFPHHPGVDPLALLRAAAANRSAGRVVMGGSTITQQLVRLLDPRPGRRGIGRKAAEALDALRLELRLDKETILTHYLNRLAFGRGAVGLEAAAQAWFGHSARTLTPGEAAWLAILPRAPARYGRLENLGALERRRQSLVRRLARRGVIEPAALAAALEPPALSNPGAPPFEAPHLTAWFLDNLPPELRNRAGRLRTTIDAGLQREAEARLAARLDRLAEKGARQAALVVLHNPTREIRALIGSTDFFDPRDGQVNGALARRQPGSTLKPFTYALAFESGMTPASLVRDESRPFAAAGGPFVPRNYGGVTFGPVRIREALGSSLNVAAVDALTRVGVDRLHARLVALGLLAPGGSPGESGLGLTLGVEEVRLLDLVNAYATLAEGGLHREPVALLAALDPAGRRLPLPAPEPATRVLDRLACWWIADILADDGARLRAFGRGSVLDMPWPVSVKTGTSSDWRDNWTVAFSREWTVGVWVGDFSGRPLRQVSGVWGAAPLVRDLFAILAARGALTAPARPDGLVPVTLCAASGAPATPGCPGRIEEWLPPARRAGSPCRLHAPEPVVAGTVAGRGRLAIERPAAGETYFIDPALPPGSQGLSFQARAEGVVRVRWSIDGRPIGTTESDHRIDWRLAAGRHRLRAEAGGEVAEVGFDVVTGSARAGEAP